MDHQLPGPLAEEGAEEVETEARVETEAAGPHILIYHFRKLK